MKVDGWIEVFDPADELLCLTKDEKYDRVQKVKAGAIEKIRLINVFLLVFD